MEEAGTTPKKVRQGTETMILNTPPKPAHPGHKVPMNNLAKRTPKVCDETIQVVVDRHCRETSKFSMKHERPSS